MSIKTYPTPAVMLTALSARFGHEAMQAMISAEVVANDCRIMRMQAVANLWERHCAVADFEFVAWNFCDTTVRLFALTEGAKARLGGAVSATVITSALPSLVATLESEGFVVRESAEMAVAA